MRKGAWLVAAAALAIMTVLGLGSMRQDSATADEGAHVAAGYAYLHYGDYRLNSEHPPLMKALSALPLQLMHLRYPTDSASWLHAPNGEYGVGADFLYHEGNDADRVLFWARVPILLTAVAGGAFLFAYARRRHGDLAGCIAVVLYAFSPNVLAHARFVTQDVGVSVLALVALVAFARMARRPTPGRAAMLAVALALATLAKFSALLLYPVLGVLALLAAALTFPDARPRHGLRVVAGFAGAAAGSLLLVYLAYLPLTASTPTRLMRVQVARFLPADYSEPLLHLFGHTGAKPLITFLFGVFQTLAASRSRTRFAYYDGHVTHGANLGYFPLSFALKTQVALLLLLVVVPLLQVWLGLARRERGRPSPRTWLAAHFDEVVLGAFAATYFVVAATGGLNIGIRHILPVYPPLFVLVAAGLAGLLRAARGRRRLLTAGAAGSALLLTSYVVSDVAAYPRYVPYFNALAGGSSQASRWFADSNVDWGQDLRRLKSYLDAHPEITTLALDYFGSADPAYYFCAHRPTRPTTFDCSSSRMVRWRADQGPYPGTWIAVSETHLVEPQIGTSRGQGPAATYDYLRRRRPVARVGDSIYVYRLS